MKENPHADMDKGAYRIAYLIAAFIRGTITEKEHDELDAWVNANDHNMFLFEELTDEKNIEANLQWMDNVQSEQSLARLRQSGAFKKPTNKKRITGAWLAAASIVLLAGAFFIYRYSNAPKSENNKIAVVDTITPPPGGNKATLTISDGSVIDLTASAIGLVKKDQGSDILKTADGEIVYERNSASHVTISQHTLSTPVGGQYQVTLPDRTKVWLNAASSLSYPSQFLGNDRKVELMGEAYFEVAKNERQPFQVLLSDSASVSVLGTHFNIMAYANENAKEITLVEGIVAVKNRNKNERLEPGMQASITGGDVIRREEVDTEETIGWKNGYFVFRDASMHSIMRQVERWYNVEVVYKHESPHHFNATLLRSDSITKLLRILELTGYVHFKIENKTIYVLP